MGIEELSSLKVGDVMSRSVLTIREDETIIEAVKKMSAMNFGAIVAINSENKVSGIFSERDILKKVIPEDKDPKTTTVSEIMTANPKTVSSSVSLFDALTLMQTLNFRHVPVIDDDILVGIISMKDTSKTLFANIGKLIFE